jgi:hypothetical protein
MFIPTILILNFFFYMQKVGQIMTTEINKNVTYQ